jgi:hypothetical protein
MEQERRTIKFTVEVDVVNEALLRQEAIAMRTAMWGDGEEWAEDESPDVGALIYETLIASTPVEFDLVGLEIGNFTFEEA